MKNAEKIGIIGGTFNPVHYGHLFIALQARECFGLDMVVFVPCCFPPHKEGYTELAGSEDRYRMVLLAIESNPFFVISSAELERGGKSYSIETVDEFKRKYGAESRIYFIIGMDSLNELSEWKDIDKLAEKCEFIAAKRPGWTEKELRWKDRCRIMEVPLLEISSSDIRKRIKEGRSIRYLVPETVEDYISNHCLYGNS